MTTDPMDHAQEPVWWTIRSDLLLSLLYRAAGGERVDLVYLDLELNADGGDTAMEGPA